MRTHDGFKTVPCSIEKSHIQVKGKAYQLYSLEELSHFKTIYWSILIIGIPLLLCLVFLIIFCLVISQNNFQFLYYSAMLCFIITIIGVITFVCYNTLTKYRVQWIANGTKPIYIEKSDGEYIESLIVDTKRKNTDSKIQDERPLEIQDLIFMISFWALGIVLIFIPLPKRYDFICLAPIFLGFLFFFKLIEQDATWN